VQRQDIKPTHHIKLDWSEEHAEQSLLALFKQAEDNAKAAIDWYLDSRQSKKRCAQLLRVGAITLTALAGLLPIVAQMEIGKHVVEPGWASIAIGLAGLFIGIDHFFGCASSWMRFIKTEHEIRQLLHEFQMDCEAEKAAWASTPLTTEEIQRNIDRTKLFVSQVDGIIRKETDKWLAEFQRYIKETDEAIATRKTTTEHEKIRPGK